MTARENAIHANPPPQRAGAWQHVLMLAERAERAEDPDALAADEIKLLGGALRQAYAQAAQLATDSASANDRRQRLLAQLAATGAQRQAELEGRAEAVHVACLAQEQLSKQRQLATVLSEQLAWVNARLRSLAPGGSR